MMEVCYNNNNEWVRNPAQRKPKRDFRFQVIEVNSTPKWFVWPSRKGSVDLDENCNGNNKTQTSLTPSSTPSQAFATPSSTQSSAYSTSSNTSTHQANHNGYGSVRRSLVRRRNGDVEPTSLSVPPRCAACHCQILTPDRPRLESPVRKLSIKKDKAKTEPLSTSMPTFQILSIEKKWESFDAEDDDDEGLDEGVSGLQIDSKETRRWTTQ
ncbi:unnamed protein product, partial [Mesorhabditis belari]|uniref:Uncharacterized protein n=1 Tax=Mesorhabditis belari TaxID=2138241 RepID=A0AAF3EWF7_9BILA